MKNNTHTTNNNKTNPSTNHIITNNNNTITITNINTNSKLIKSTNLIDLKHQEQQLITSMTNIQNNQKQYINDNTFTSSLPTEDLHLYVELYDHMTKGDDIKALAIARLLLQIYPDNIMLKEYCDVLFESLKHRHEPEEAPMDKHMKLNVDGEYEYVYSDNDENNDDDLYK